MKKGQVVISKCGRDKGLALVVIDNDHDNYVYLVDGRLRRLCKPKKKKVRHLQPTNYFVELEYEGRGLQDADIRKSLWVLWKGGKPFCQKPT